MARIESVSATKRKLREFQILKSSLAIRNYGLIDDDTDHIYIKFDGPTDSAFTSGQYILYIKLNEKWPFDAPVVQLLTPSGRFSPATPICINGITHYHGDTYSPKLTLESLVIGFMSMMLENIEGVAHISSSDDEKRKLARLSVKWNTDWEKNNGITWMKPTSNTAGCTSCGGCTSCSV